MSLKRHLASMIFLVGLSSGLALFLLLVIRVERLSVFHHSYPFDFSLWSVLFILSCLFFVALGIFWVRVFRPYFSADKTWRTVFSLFSPWLAFLLSPFLLRFYWSRQDLVSRLLLLVLFVILASLSIGLLAYEKATQRLTGCLRHLINYFHSLPRRRKLVILFFAAFLLYQAATLLLVLEGITFSGDEPNYLLTTHSLLYDGDINLANNYARQDYYAFYSREEHPRLKLGIYGRYGRKGKDYIYPINLPGISVLMMPFYALSQLFHGKILTFILKGSLSLWAALFSLQVYLLARQRWGREGLALGLWFLTSFTPPVLFYSHHLYPEMPMAFFSLLIFRRLIAPHPPSWLEALGLGFLLGTFPWFGLKYNFIFWPLLLIGVFRLWRHYQAKGAAAVFLLLPVISQVLFYFFIYQLYGTFSPIAVYEGVMTSEQLRAFRQMVLEIPWRQRVESLLDYFLDQRDGLLLYSPLYFFALAGIIDLAKRAKRLLLSLLFICLPFLSNYSFFTHRQGYSPQARVLTPIIWIGILALGEFIYSNQKSVFRHFFSLSVLISFLLTGLLLFHPTFLYQPTTHEFTSRPGDLFVYLSNTHFFLPSWLPSFIKINNINYWPNYFWIFLLGLFLLTYAFSRHRFFYQGGFGQGSCLALFALALFLWVLFPRPALYPLKTITYSPQRSLGFYLFSLGKGVVAKEAGDFYLHLEKPYRFIFSARQELKRIQLIFGSETGDYNLSLQAFDQPLAEERIRRARSSLEVDLPPAYKRRHLFLYEITVKLKHLSSESMLLEPFLFQIIPGRR